MKFYTHSYELKPLHSPNSLTSSLSRQGMLICVEDQDHLKGYADLHPWPELGDSTLQEILNAKSSSLFEAARTNAITDLHARQKKQDLLLGAESVRSHYLCPDLKTHGLPASLENLAQAQKEGYQTAKIKCGRDINFELQVLEMIPTVFAGQLRLDFNASLDFLQAQNVINSFSPKLKNQIEFIEDPCIFKMNNWRDLNKLIPLACDFCVPEEEVNLPFQYRIVKPSRMKRTEFEALLQDTRTSVVVTTQMGHGVDTLQAFASVLSCSQLRRQTHGLQTFDLYEKDVISQHLKKEGSAVKGFQRDIGLGSGSVLERLTWTPLP